MLIFSARILKFLWAGQGGSILLGAGVPAVMCGSWNLRDPESLRKISLRTPHN